MSHWLLKTEPSTYAFENLVRDKKTTWDGIHNPVALKNLRAMVPGDHVFIYHTGEEKRIVGLAKIMSAAYPDPKGKDPRLQVIDLAPIRAVRKPVALADIKANAKLAHLAVVRQPRLSVAPIDDAAWRILMKMAGEP